jgi:hypothetical protein
MDGGSVDTHDPTMRVVLVDDHLSTGKVFAKPFRTHEGESSEGLDNRLCEEIA